MSQEMTQIVIDSILEPIDAIYTAEVVSHFLNRDTEPLSNTVVNGISEAIVDNYDDRELIVTIERCLKEYLRQHPTDVAKIYIQSLDRSVDLENFFEFIKAEREVLLSGKRRTKSD
jgi:hypothetical protein